MVSAPVRPLWSVVQAQAVGVRHHESQDAVRRWTGGGDGVPAVVAVADGHGGARHVRSRQGALLAVEVACEVFAALLAGSAPGTPLPQRLASAPERIGRTWRERVADDLRERPLSAEELGAIPDEPAVRSVVLNPALAYGATLLAVCVGDEGIHCLQLGDGDILVVSEDGEVSRPIAPDPALIANETTSLCMAEPWKLTRTATLPLGPPPALLVLSTDGYANSYANEEDFRRIGPDFLRLIREKGLDWLAGELPGWLEETTRGGSGDDITVALVVRESALSPKRPVVRVRRPDDADVPPDGEATLPDERTVAAVSGAGTAAVASPAGEAGPGGDAAAPPDGPGPDRPLPGAPGPPQGAPPDGLAPSASRFAALRARVGSVLAAEVPVPGWLLALLAIAGMAAVALLRAP